MLQDFENLKRIVVTRRTEKVIAALDSPVNFSEEIQRTWKDVVVDAVSAAGMAPFHFDRGVDSIPEPWRIHLLDTETCRALARNIGNWMDLKPSNKIPGLLSACGCVLLSTWIPQFRSPQLTDESLSAEKKTEIDDEHLAATAAMVQTQLLLLTAAGLGTYWSSGGVLGASEVFGRLGIDGQERLMAAIFVEYPGNSNGVIERLPGKNRVLRTKPELWFSEARLSSV